MASYYAKLLENSSLRDDVENICDIYLKHHSIKMNI
jgi:hypothetical protein